MATIDRPGTDDPAPPASVDSFLEAKLHWPPPRAEWLRRARLLERMGAVRDHPVTLVAAPAGYGKTIMLAQWLEETHPRAAWVSLDPGDNDGNRMWAHVAEALDRAGCRPDPRAQTRESNGSTAPGTGLTTIVDALAAVDEEIVLVLDDFHCIRDPRCHAQVQVLVERLPPRAHLVISTRSDPGLRLGRLRASGDLVEIRAAHLGFTHEEAGTLLGRASADLSDDSVGLLMQRTEGWPAGLYLAGLSLAGHPEPNAFVRDFSGGNRYIGDYLTEEVLSHHGDEVRDFIMTVSVLDRFSAALCDHVRGTSGSAALLRELQRTNLFLMPLDDEGRWYRFHHLFAAVARSELEVLRPGEIPALHARAADWFSAQGNADEAVQHAIAAGDAATAALLVQRHWLHFVDEGRLDTVLGWARAIGPLDDASGPGERVTSAWLAAFAGDEASLTDALAILDAVRAHGPLPDGSQSVESALAMIDGLFGYAGAERMIRGAECAVALETDRGSAFYSLAQVSLGHACYVAGGLDRALIALDNATDNEHAPAFVRSLALAVESLVEHERANLERSRLLAERSMVVVEGHGLSAAPQASLAYTALGQAQAAAGRLDEALKTLAGGLALCRATPAVGPWGTIHHLLIHARVAAEAGLVLLAGDLLDELKTRWGPFIEGTEAMQSRADGVRRAVESHGVEAVAGLELTGREIDILRLLQGDLSLPEIAAELYLSANTVKTHSRSVYRKLGAHTRAEAVLVARRRGLV